MPLGIKHFATVAALAIGACNTGLVRLQTEHNQSNYDYQNFTIYHAGRDTRVIIHGNPFGMDQAAFNKAVTDNMQGATPGRRTNFTTTPGKTAQHNL
jgi:hypothetical protein